MNFRTMRLKRFELCILAFLSLMIIGCQEEFTPPVSEFADQLVVEGYIEAGDLSNPTYVLITQSVPFFNELDANQYANLFVSGAEVSVDDGDKEVALTELCLSEIQDPVFQQAISEELGINIDEIEVDICVYIDLFDELVREEGRSYQLTILSEDETLSATTTIPPLVRLDSFEFREIPGEPIDSLAFLYCFINDPEELNYYRYFTDDDFGNLNTPFGSITDDIQFNGQEFEFPLQQADLQDTFDFNTYGYFNVGDTVTIKWTTIDKAHYDFWNTFEYSLNGQGSPFTGYTRILDNIEGGFGIWGGYNVQLEELVVEKVE